jgi:hypothetical protein
MSGSAIYASIIQVMRELGAVKKTSVNKSQGFNYRSIDSVMNALQPRLVAANIFIVPSVKSITYTDLTTAKGTTMQHAKAMIEFRFVSGLDGSYIEALIASEAMDMGDKATNKVMSVGFKYACFQVFCIPTEEMLDSDASTPEPRITFKNPAEAISWASQELNISEAEATKLMNEVEPDQSGKKAIAFVKLVNSLKK